MFDIGASELLLIVIVAIVVIGPKDLPLALRTAGRWIGQIRRVSGHFRSGIETMIREAELEEMEKKWREQNAAIMQLPEGETDGSMAGATAESAVLNQQAQLAVHTPVPDQPDPRPVAAEQGEPVMMPLPASPPPPP